MLFAQELEYFNLIFVPIYCFYRIRKNKYTLLNASFHILVLSYLYFTISSFFLDEFIEFQYSVEPWFSTFSSESIAVTSLLCNWFTLVSLFFYSLSKEPKEIKIAFFPQKITYQIALIVTFSTTAIFIALLLIHGPSLIANSSNRFYLLRYFSQEFIGKYKYLYLMNILLASLSVIAWRKRTFKYFWVLIVPVITEFLTKGRDISFYMVVYTYINYVAVTKKLQIALFSPLILGIVGVGIIRSNNLDRIQGIGDTLLYVSAEVTATRLTTVITYNSFMNDGDLWTYLLNSILNVFPSSITSILIDSTDIYSNTIREYYRTKLQSSSTGLAGNIVSEALYYGGISFAIITPIIIGAIFLFLNRIKIYRTLPGFIYYCIVIARLRNYFRIGFYNTFFSLITLMLTLLLWIVILEYDNRRVHPKLDSPTLVNRQHNS